MNPRNSNLPHRALALVAVATLGFAACGSDDASSDDTEQSTDAVEADGVTMTDAWSRQPAEGQTTAAVYGVLTNDTDETVTAISATSSATDNVELHEVLMGDDDQMTMQEKEGGYEIAAGESLTFEPGGAHIMLLDIDAASYPDPVDITLTFDNDTSVEFTAEVRAIDGEDMDDMDHDGMDDTDHSEMDDDEMDDMDDMDEAPTTDG
ncbi:copper chaperone PCu(A)C [Ilumatobacter nonamiensis]|uniref:copper chaperone PCu(A)C n=1 Tax=Ilumatobacter nonamiensis TaxID=467093 RepID=UPI000345A710|nr:copper chaperone PCu(A)C [Ilumatobacter nonamiensis]